MRDDALDDERYLPVNFIPATQHGAFLRCIRNTHIENIVQVQQTSLYWFLSRPERTPITFGKVALVLLC
jgi:hypothetical protein